MKLLNSKELKIFFTFLIIYSFFVYWIGWDEQSHFFLTRSIVDEGRFEIDSFYNQTSDRAFYNGHYYSDKDPGLSFLAVPTYAAWKFIYYNLFPKSFQLKYEGTNEYISTEVGENKVPVNDYVNHGFFILISMILVIIFTSSLFSALTIVLIYKISKYFTKNEKYRLLLIIAAGLGTLLFPYALVFMEHSVATFFGFFSFFLLFKIKQDKIDDKKYFILAGLSSGFAITCSAVMFIIGLACLVYLISFRREKTTYFLIGGLLGLLPFLLYNYFIFGTPFTLPRLHMDPIMWSKLNGIYGLQLPNLFIFLRLTFDPYKGIFFYYPILLLSFVGLYYMYKKFKAESILILFIFFTFLIMNSSWWAWWGGRSFGPRLLTPVSPFLIIPLIYVLKATEKRKYLQYLIFILIFYSIFVNFIGLQSIEDMMISKDSMFLDQKYSQKVYSLDTLPNTLYEYYLPLFLKFGPRSKIFENLINNYIDIDIRIVPLSKGAFFPLLEYYLPFFSLIPIFVFIIILWGEEVLPLIFRYKFIISLLFFSLILFLFLRFINPPEISLQKEWYPSSSGEDINWMRNNGTLLIYNKDNTLKEYVLSFKEIPFDKEGIVNLYLNDQKIGSFWSFLTSSKIIINFTLESHMNIIKFQMLENCSIKLPDSRCISLGISNVSLDKPEEGINFAENWYPSSSGEDINWMRNNGTLLIYNKDNTLKEYVLSFKTTSPIKSEINVYLNEQKTGSFWPIGKVLISLYLNSGYNTLRFENLEPCKIELPDVRCRSLGVMNMTFKSSK